MSACPFCAGGADPVLQTELALGFDDAFPASPGHMLLTPRRHVQRFADLTSEERHALWDLVPAACGRIASLYRPDGYNIGLNDGEAAGQTVMHVHVHIIPRYAGDLPDPRGGIRWVLPERAAYWEP